MRFSRYEWGSSEGCEGGKGRYFVPGACARWVLDLVFFFFLEWNGVIWFEGAYVCACSRRGAA